MDKNLLIQSTLVGVVVLGALIWAAYRVFFRKNKGKGDNCSCCSLSDNCKKINRK